MWRKTQKAFTFVELLISMVITGLVGGVAVAALWFMLNTRYQMEDYTATESEMEYAVQRLSRDFAMIGLGMPNNRQAMGSFVLSFRDPDTNKWPITAFFGAPGSAWGGPVTVANANPSHTYDAATITDPGLGAIRADSYVGPELYYAWAVPTGVKAGVTSNATPSSSKATNNTPLTLFLYPRDTKTGNVNGAQYLKEFKWDGRDIGVQTVNDDLTTGKNMRAWVLFPTLLLPMRADAFDGTSLDVMAAPVADTALPPGWIMKRTIMELDEVHLMQAARLYRDSGSNELRRVVFNTDYTAANGNFQEEVLARHVVGLQFAYSPTERLLTMYIAARGQEGEPIARGQPTEWPSWLPSLAGGHYRVAVKILTWRIRN